MELPAAVESRLDGGSHRTVTLADDDLVVCTSEETILYRGARLLSDAEIEVYDHDIERLGLEHGRQQTTFVLESTTGVERFSVPGDRARAVLEGLLAGVLETTGVTDTDERLHGVYRFSDLTLVVTDARLLKHVGSAIWEPTCETFPLETVTGLEFESGARAIQAVVRLEDRAERIKIPNSQAPQVRETLTEAVLDFHDLDTLDALNASHRSEPAPDRESLLDDSIDPLIDPDAGDPGRPTGDPTAVSRDTLPDTDPANARSSESDTGGTDAAEERLSESDTGDTQSTGGRSPEADDTGERSPSTLGTASASASGETREFSFGDEGEPSDPTDSSGGDDSVDGQQLEREIRALRETLAEQRELIDRQSEQLSRLADRVEALERD